MKKILVLLIAASAIFLTSCGDDDTSSKSCNPACEEWQTCNEDTCELKSDRCNENTDCKEDGKPVCNAEHTCVAETSTFCEADTKRCNAKNVETCKADGSAWELTTNCVNDNKQCEATGFTCEEAPSNCIGVSFESSLQLFEASNEYMGTSGQYDILVGFYTIEGDESTRTSVGNYDLASSTNNNYETCLQCVTVDKYNSNDEREKIFFQESGELNISRGIANDGESIGEILNLKLVEVNISSVNVSTPVPNGECLEIETGTTLAWNTMCEENMKRCSEDRTAIRTCGANGEWTEVTCENAGVCTQTTEEDIACEEIICEAGTKRCSETDETKIETCNELGTAWEESKTCTNSLVCNAESFTCEIPACTEGTKRCSADNSGIETCDADGAWISLACEGEATCTGNTETTICREPVADGEWIKVATGSNHSCGIRVEETINKLYCWGKSTNGQLGNNNITTNKLVPTEVSITENSEWTDVSTGSYHTCAIKAGKVYCFGKNDKGQLGDATNEQRNTPVELSITDNNNWISVKVGSNHSCGIKVEEGANKLYCWGLGVNGELGNGELVDGESQNKNIPTEVSSGWESVSLGAKHTCGIKDEAGVKKAYCWGSGAFGKLGYAEGGTDYKNVPTKVAGINTQWLSISAAFSHTCAVKTTGELYCWGDSAYNKTGLDSTTDVSVPTLVTGTGWKAVSSGNHHSCGIKEVEGIDKAFCWGRGTGGALGTNSEETLGLPTEIQGENWISIESSGYYTCGIKIENGENELYCWGKGSNGRTGLGHTDNALVPTLIP